MTFAEGRLVLHRDTHHGAIAFVHPTRVISDDDRGLLLWLARGSVVAVESTADGRSPRDMTFAEWSAMDRGTRLTSWRGPGVLRFFPPRANHSVWFFRTDDGVFKQWYVNLEEHAVRKCACACLVCWSFTNRSKLVSGFSHGVPEHLF